MLSPTSIRDDVNTIWKQKSNAAKKSWIAAHVITRNGGVFELLTVSDMLQIARLSPCVGRTYLQQLLGMPASATAQYLRAARLRKAHTSCCAISCTGKSRGRARQKSMCGLAGGINLLEVNQGTGRTAFAACATHCGGIIHRVPWW